jgi:hypothetical protein
VLTGGPAVGKTTCGRRLAGSRATAAYVDVDDLRQLVVSGAAAPWQGPEGARQRLLSATNACALAGHLLAAGFETVIADVVSPSTAAVYRRELPGCLLVHLRISLDAALERAATRHVYLTDDEFRWLHRQEVEQPPPADLVLQVDGWTVDEQCARLEQVWSRAGSL